MRLRSLSVFAGVALLQMCVAFWAWSSVPGNASPGRGTETARLVWDIVSFPAFWLYRGYRWFAVLFVIDGFLWSAVLLALCGFVRVTLRGRRSADNE